MKNAIIFLAGVVVGAAGAIIWLRKDIKKQLEEIKKGEDLPFVMGENTSEGDSNAKNDENADKVTVHEPVIMQNQQRIEYNKIVEQVKNGEKERQGAPVPIFPRDDGPKNEEITDEDDDGEEVNVNVRRETFEEIDQEEFENNPEYTKKRLVYFRGDRVMSTDEGTLIANPYLFVGGQWEQCVGHYADRTAFIRNLRLSEDYEIYVEDGAYVDEYGYDSL